MLKYKVCDNVFETVEKVAEYIMQNINHEEIFTKWLDKNYKPINVCGYEFKASMALKQLDMKSYNEELETHMKTAYDKDIMYELNYLHKGEEHNFFGIIVKCFK